ncbi:hypothetical protein ALC56_09356 [Trachymyrmex septentrionalis]|uniref:Uncharacterized protein n=1 Tax=Trachymyrmex septentrionalis TaxID=34720 RepID=A0A195F7N8_9HYME|nr:hypothetical protein ALC56_09356 [Trachymyrmex septentrionalis]
MSRNSKNGEIKVQESCNSIRAQKDEEEEEEEKEKERRGRVLNNARTSARGSCVRNQGGGWVHTG